MMISSHLGGSLILLKTVEDTSVLLTCSLASHNPKEPLQKSVTANIGKIVPSRLCFFSTPLELGPQPTGTKYGDVLVDTCGALLTFMTLGIFGFYIFRAASMSQKA